MKKHNNKIFIILFFVVLFLVFIIKFSYPDLIIEGLNEKIHNTTSEIAVSIINNISSFSSETEIVITPTKNDYAYNQLDTTEQSIYKIFLSGIINFKSFVLIPSITMNQASKIFNFILSDFPEIFWVKKTFTMSSEFINKCNFSYIYTKEEVKEKQNLIDNTVNTFLNSLPSNLTDYEKVLKAYNYIIKNTAYKLNSKDNQFITSVFIEKESVCGGYSRAFQYLLKKMDIPSTYIIGDISEPNDHAWNMILLDNEYYFIDVTWGDLIFEKPEDSDPNLISYEYFCITTEELLKTHKLNNSLKLPLLKATKYNYFTYNNILFNEFDYDIINNKIITDGINGEKYIQFKFTNLSSYSSAVDTLIENQRIFDVLNNIPNSNLIKTSYNYSLNENFLIISFRLNYK
ncbi:MAG: hypothetical protein K0S55_222 [Clostridia bacterium]|nr:hypothetical protein [Clostridia bacterium]